MLFISRAINETATRHLLYQLSYRPKLRRTRTSDPMFSRILIPK